jgi:hypothetical protein
MMQLLLALPDIIRLILKIMGWVEDMKEKKQEKESEKRVDDLKNAKTPEEIRNATDRLVDGA